MGVPNWTNRTIWTGDNLPIMRGMNSECVDLVYLDPPFNSKANYAAPIGSQAAGAAFKDTWSLEDVDLVWLDLIEAKEKPLANVLRAAMNRSDQSYLIYMAVRLLEMKRLLKPSGSIYLHCDPTMSHYLKLVMDAVFGRKNFRNEIVWRRATAHNDPNRYGNNTDRLLYYLAGETGTWNGTAIAVPKNQEELAQAYPQRDSRGRYRADNLTGASSGGGESSQPWNGYDVASRNRHWSPPLTGKYSEFIEHRFIAGYRSIKSVHARLDALDSAGLIHHPKKGTAGWPGLKRYAQADTGNAVQSLFTDIQGFTNYNKGKEWVGYPTQKPLALLDRIIRASSNEDDMVFDPFCGCATTLVAADRLQRRWAGIDLSEKAVELVQQRISTDQGAIFESYITRTDIPQRTDLIEPPKYNSLDIRKSLYGEQAGHCNGCRTHFQMRNFTVDHIIPRSKGGTDHIENLQLLCGNCNSIKGNRPQEYLLTRLADSMAKY